MEAVEAMDASNGVGRESGRTEEVVVPAEATRKAFQVEGTTSRDSIASPEDPELVLEDERVANAAVAFLGAA
eukprot:1586979-Prorocentrum_lima.AAC.1